MVHLESIQRYAYDGASPHTVMAAVRYSLEKSTTNSQGIGAVLEYPFLCPIHGTRCMGHMECYNGMVFLPTFMTPGTQEQPHRLMVAKRAVVQGNMEYEDYLNLILGSMRGKIGTIRSMNSMTVQGSIRMVISAGSVKHSGVVTIPETVATHTRVLDCSSGTYEESTVRTGDYAILVRQPCMWSGGIQPVKILVTPPDRGDNGEWDVNSSMRLPVSMCGPFAADYDGDEMSLFVVRDSRSIAECTAFQWSHSEWSPYDAKLSHQVVSAKAPATRVDSEYQAMCTTLCWSDRLRSVVVTKCHENWLTKKSQFISLTATHGSVDDFINSAMSLVKSTCSKSSLQSDIGALSRRTKLGAERVTLDRRGLPLVKAKGRSWSHLIHLPPSLDAQSGWFGIPSVRAVSKLCASVMQITLKTKSMGTVQSLSPTLSLLEGSKSWITVMMDGSIVVSNRPTLSNYHSVKCTCSLVDISHAPPEHRPRLISEFISIVLCEANRRLDNAELWSLQTLMMSLTTNILPEPTGIQFETHRVYKELNTLQTFNGCYVTRDCSHTPSIPTIPCSVVECMMLGNFTHTPSIHRV